MKSPCPGVSLVICCFNGASRIPETLRHIRAQRVRAEIPWEVILVDNRSTDGTAEIAEELMKDGSIPFRAIHEPKPGVAHARVRGVADARFEYVSFIDDDNWIDQRWVETVYDTFAENPSVGIFGGPIEAQCEIPSPDWWSGVAPWYAVSSRGPDRMILPSQELIYGAGMCLRRSVLVGMFEKGFRFQALSRAGAALNGGEDHELCIVFSMAGWELLYEPKLKMTHFIPRQRLQWSYAKRLLLGAGQTSLCFDAYEIALLMESPDDLNRLRYRVGWRFLGTLKQIARIPWSAWKAALRDRPGDRAVVPVWVGIGRLRAFLLEWRSYRGRIQRVFAAEWFRERDRLVRAGSEPSTL